MSGRALVGTKYHLTLRVGARRVVDEDGPVECGSVSEALRLAAILADDAVCDPLLPVEWGNAAFEVHDGVGRLVGRAPLSEALVRVRREVKAQ